MENFFNVTKDHMRGAVSTVFGIGAFLVKRYKAIKQDINDLGKKIDAMSVNLKTYIDEVAKNLSVNIDDVDERRQTDYHELKLTVTAIQSTVVAMDRNVTRIDDSMTKLTHVVANGNAAKLSMYDDLQEIKNLIRDKL